MVEGGENRGEDSRKDEYKKSGPGSPARSIRAPSNWPCLTASVVILQRLKTHFLPRYS